MLSLDNTTACIGIISDFWAETPGDCDTCRSVGKHDAKAWAVCSSGMRPVVADPDDDVRASPLAGRERCAVLVMLP